MSSMFTRYICRRLLQLIVFTCAFIVGAFFAFIWKSQDEPSIHPTKSYLWTPSIEKINIDQLNYTKWLNNKKLKLQSIPEEVISFDLQTKKSLYNGKRIKLESEYLKDQFQFLCLIWSKNKNLAKSISLTWGKNCNKIYFIASYIDKSLPTIKYSTLEPSHVSFCKILVKLKLTLPDLMSNIKWILLAQDTSFVILENARYFIASLNHSQPYYFGRPVKTNYDLPIYNKLDSSILLSIGSLKYIYDNYFHNYASCNLKSFNVTNEEGASNLLNISREMAISLAQMLSINSIASPVDTSDSSGSKFLPFSLSKHIIPGEISQYNPIWRQDVTKTPSGANCCSDHLISFNELTPTKMYLVNYLLYHLAVFKDSPCGLGNKKPRVYSSNSLFNDKISLGSMKDNVEVGSGFSHHLTSDINSKSYAIGKSYKMVINVTMVLAIVVKQWMVY